MDKDFVVSKLLIVMELGPLELEAREIAATCAGHGELHHYGIRAGSQFKHAKHTDSQSAE